MWIATAASVSVSFCCCFKVVGVGFKQMLLHRIMWETRLTEEDWEQTFNNVQIMARNGKLWDLHQTKIRSSCLWIQTLSGELLLVLVSLHRRENCNICYVVIQDKIVVMWIWLICFMVFLWQANGKFASWLNENSSSYVSFVLMHVLYNKAGICVVSGSSVSKVIISIYMILADIFIESQNWYKNWCICKTAMLKTVFELLWKKVTSKKIKSKYFKTHCSVIQFNLTLRWSGKWTILDITQEILYIIIVLLG